MSLIEPGLVLMCRLVFTNELRVFLGQAGKPPVNKLCTIKLSN